MYRKLLASTALSLVMTGGVLAQAVVTEPAPMDPALDAPAMETQVETTQTPLVTATEIGINANGWLATEIIGETIYNSTMDDAENIGEVNDFVLDQNGSIGAVVVGVGGFLGIGQKNVAIDWNDLELVVDADGNQRLVANMTREQLENAAEFDRAEWLASESANRDGWTDGDVNQDPAMTPADPMAPAADPMAPATGMEPADPMVPGNELNEAEPAAPITDTTPMAPAPVNQPAAGAEGTIGWDTYAPVMTSEVTAEELTGTTVYGAGDEDIGSIGDIILSDSGEVEAVIIDFGGFLGIGTKPVAVGFENLDFLRDENGDLVLRTSLTREQLDAAPEYNADAYLEAPGENVVIVN